MSQTNILNLSMPILSEQGDVQQYIKYVSSIPNLEIEEERNLMHKMIQEKDLKAAQTLARSHLKLVAAIALKFRGYGFPLVELIAEGNFGLIQAIKKFRPEIGARLSTYASWWIRAAIQEYVIKSWSLVKIGTTSAQKKLFFNLNKVKKKIIGAEQQIDKKSAQLIANYLNVSSEEVREMSNRMGGKDLSLNTPIYDNEGSKSELLEIIPNSRPSQETILIEHNYKQYQHMLLKKAITVLNEREYKILAARWLNNNPITLAKLAEDLKISTERVRQIEESAMRKIKTYIEAHSE